MAKRTQAEYEEAAKNSTSIAGMIRYLGLKDVRGGNYETMKKWIHRYNINTDHFTGQGWNKGNYASSPTTITAIKSKLIRDRGHKCESCKLDTWLDKPITLELEHIDAVKSNNDPSNLLLLCPNCHAQTPTWHRGNRIETREATTCPDCLGSKHYSAKRCQKCRIQFKALNPSPKQASKASVIVENFCACGAEIGRYSKACISCSHKSQMKIVWPSIEEMVEVLQTTSFVQYGKILGVSNNAISKHLIKNHIDTKTLKKVVKTV